MTTGKKGMQSYRAAGKGRSEGAHLIAGCDAVRLDNVSIVHVCEGDGVLPVG